MTDPHRSLYVLASKWGTTIEPNVLAAYFRQRLLDAGISLWGAHFVAITDPGTALDTHATAEGFREVFRNPPDIGGRYSAISFFGLVPGALMGCDGERLVADASGVLGAAQSMTLSTAARRGGAPHRVDAFLRLLGRGDYLAVLAYLPESGALTATVSRFRAEVRHRTGCATMFGYGPRYLHSTGQLHKGGPNTGVFLVLTTPGADVPVPGEVFTFGILELAQALGDTASLDQAGRPALHVHLPPARCPSGRARVRQPAKGYRLIPRPAIDGVVTAPLA